MGPNLLVEDITVNAILPAFVPTGLAPKELLAVWPERYITPISTVLRAYHQFIDDGTLTGQCGECSVDQIHFRPVLDYPDESQRWIGQESMKLWDNAYGIDK
jgi:15-hydroxyprostaglandin dehydrogenase (NAD)